MIFNQNKITVTQSLYNIPHMGFIFDEAKTNKSRRTIYASTILIKKLKKYKQSSNELVICKNGKPIHPSSFSRYFKREVALLGLPKIKLHGLRHTHATILMKLGEHPKVVSERLGHSNISITLDVYSHVTSDMQKEAADKFEKALQG